MRFFFAATTRSSPSWRTRVIARAGGARFVAMSLVLASFVWAPTHTAAQGKNGTASKLDRKVQALSQEAIGESDVIIEFTDDREALKVVQGFGKAGRKLGILKAYSAKVPNKVLARLAEHNLIKKVSLDRAVATLNGRTAITTGARAVQQLSGYTGAGIGVAVIDSGVTS